MTLFDGKPTNESLANRYEEHPVKIGQQARYDEIRQGILATAVTIVELTPYSPEQRRALDALDVAMWAAFAAIGRNE